MIRHAADNPFRAQSFHALPYRGGEGFNLDVLASRFWVQGGRGALVGPHGHGKTTLLRDFGETLAASGLLCVPLNLNTTQRRIPADFYKQLDTASVILLDGAEQLSPLAWRVFLWRTRRVRGLVVTTHNAGRLPLLHDCNTSEELMGELLRELAPIEAESFTLHAKQLYREHGGNLREVWFGLYNAYAVRV